MVEDIPFPKVSEAHGAQEYLEDVAHEIWGDDYLDHLPEDTLFDREMTNFFYDKSEENTDKWHTDPSLYKSSVPDLDNANENEPDENFDDPADQVIEAMPLILFVEEVAKCLSDSTTESAKKQLMTTRAQQAIAAAKRMAERSESYSQRLAERIDQAEGMLNKSL